MNRISRHYPSQEQLREIFRYDAEQGLLIRKDVRPKGRTGLTKPHIYRSTTIKYRGFPHHRLVWIYHHGDPGQLMVDHINRDRHDDRIENLRLVTAKENRRNSRMFKTNTSGYKGVTLEKRCNKWKAYIYVNNVRKHLGMFHTKEEAAAAYQKAAAELHGEFAGSAA